ncbi:MAG: L-2-hydroxyglutarate oxidase [Nocardioides sp.]|nr:L-2-hydroxyglutarate oxidase [Nocardioides sp.]
MTQPVHDHVVVGGGIVGLSTALHLLRSRPGADVLVLEKEATVGRHQTGHNSGVVHSGIYYEPGSLKARMCREGSHLTKEYAAEHGIPLEVIGKLLVATDSHEFDGMDALAERARVNGVEAEVIDAAELRRREPHVTGLAALWLPGTAITDYGAITRALADDVRSLGGAVVTGCEVETISETRDEVRLATTAAATAVVRSRQITFCAGVQADRVARMAGLPVDFAMLPFRGEYYDVVPERADLVSTLIYPIPDPSLPFLGVHLTPTVDGGLTVGPNAVLGFAREGYPRLSFDWRDTAEMARFRGTYPMARAHLRTGVRELRNSLWKAGYLRECQKYAPGLTAADLVPREAGIRAQAVLSDGTFVHDFLLRRTPRSVHVINAPSPAATSALPIGRALARMAITGSDADP